MSDIAALAVGISLPARVPYLVGLARHPPGNLATLPSYVGRLHCGIGHLSRVVTAAMCNGESLRERWLTVVTRPESRRLRRRQLNIRERPDGRWAVVDGYGWSVEFALFDSRECAELFIAQGFFHH